ncbi:MAG TPA: decaprenyl-phosphate phosphoribosyltransferase [Nocardioidaceae bacterium]|nr:decaprenyl-phosphate phosphoribosyltransferase [Nocardioidaceae bacterium]
MDYFPPSSSGVATSPLPRPEVEDDAFLAPARPMPWALLAAARPRQWVKNLLVLAAPLAAGRVDESWTLWPMVAAFVIFCAAASGVYLLNDVLDVEEDRRHPVKRRRPIAAGEVPRSVALLMSACLLMAAMGAAIAVRPMLGAVIAVYIGVQVSYAVSLKHEPVLDLAAVASGFLLRAIAGGVATGIALSQWFLLVAAFGSLFMVAGKRYSEIRSVGSEAGTRRALEEYSATYLRFVWMLAAGITVTAYSLWAMDAQDYGNMPWESLSIVPFVLGLLRYALDVDRGDAGAPEDIVLGDRALQALGVVWLLLVVCGIWQV